MQKDLDIQSLTISEAKALLPKCRELLELFGEKAPAVQSRGAQPFLLQAGEKVFIRTVTHYYTGCVVAVSNDEVLLKDAAWVAATGRWAQALTEGTLDEVEPYPGKVSVCRGAMVDVAQWMHDLPTEIK